MEFRPMRRHRQQLPTEECKRLLEGEEKAEALRLLGRRYNPGEEEALQREINKAAEHTAVFQLEIEHLSGKEAIELARTKSKSIHEKPS